jgi:hypothetical protein
MGEYDNLKDLLAEVEKKDIRILNFKSKRSKPQLKYFNTTNKSPILSTDIPSNTTFLEVYNCNFEKPPRKKVMPAEKQVCALHCRGYYSLIFTGTSWIKIII